MPDLPSTLTSWLAARFTAHADRIRKLAEPYSETQFWHRPFPFGNSFGHLVLHLTGNLSYYIGAQIANTGYVRDRPREFSDQTPPSKDETLRRLDAAVAMVIETIRAQRAGDWLTGYSAIGTTEKNRLGMILVCESHMQLHIGQMIYLGCGTQSAS